MNEVESLFLKNVRLVIKDMFWRCASRRWKLSSLSAGNSLSLKGKTSFPRGRAELRPQGGVMVKVLRSYSDFDTLQPLISSSFCKKNEKKNLAVQKLWPQTRRGVCRPARVFTDFPYTSILAKMGQKHPKNDNSGPKMLKMA